MLTEARRRQEANLHAASSMLGRLQHPASATQKHNDQERVSTFNTLMDLIHFVGEVRCLSSLCYL